MKRQLIFHRVNLIPVFYVCTHTALLKIFKWFPSSVFLFLQRQYVILNPDLHNFCR